MEYFAFVDVIRTIPACESWRAGASVVADSVDASAAVLADGLAGGVGSALVDVFAALGSGESDRAAAFVAVDEVEADLAVGALDRDALVDVVLAVHPLEARKAFAVEGLLRPGGDATGAVLARPGSASVEFFFAVAAGKLRRAGARVVVDAVHAGAVVEADGRRAVVDVHLAAIAREPREALADESAVEFVGARPVVAARLRGAFVHVHVAVLARPAGVADAAVVGHEIRARSRVDARIARALVHLRLAAVSFESVGALAGGRSVGGGGAGAAVQARRRSGASDVHVEIAGWRQVDGHGAVRPAEAGRAEAIVASVNEIRARAVVPARIAQARGQRRFDGNGRIPADGCGAGRADLGAARSAEAFQAEALDLIVEG